MSILMRILFLLGVLASPGGLAAQEPPNQFPNHPIRFVVPFPAGGPSDFISRVLTERMATLLGGTIVIENRPGAGGMTGIASVAKSNPDGYTIAIAPSSQLAMNINLRESMPFDPIKDLALVTQIVSVPEILVVNETVPAKTLADFVALAKAQPGKIVFASTGVGGMPHMAMELLELTADIKLVHVPYTGAAPAVNDLLGNRVQTMFADVPILLGYIQAGKLRALAIGSHSRIASLPDLATTGELAMPQVLADNWYGMVAPAGTPAPILAKLESAASQALNSSDVKARLASQGAIAVGNSSAEFQAYVKSEIERWGRLIKTTGIKIK
ncbi:MAG TPA: tripartite tricarboxylate transporter substrate binding protein [Xanthobacteraceae bacterium]|nr:tripartite tricarboxylate transporter substrate binding protein [Xanthobacteraceae bacterium]